MNRAQELWRDQAASDLRVFAKFRDEKYEPCHILHYFQMATEKLSKAYLWRSGNAPPKLHTGFVRFLRALLTRSDPELERIARIFGFRRAEDFDNWVTSVLPLAYQVQNSAPAEANDGPNPEYPWPHMSPANAPTSHTFSLWTELSETGRGNHLLDFV
jgi:hypothetical protein